MVSVYGVLCYVRLRSVVLGCVLLCDGLCSMRCVERTAWRVVAVSRSRSRLRLRLRLRYALCDLRFAFVL